ncbi:MAG TPA: acyltransferase [Allosphingosinicella sp.]|jgi:peptidoglycan/LPS O-acetylase OafA/YrhL
MTGDKSYHPALDLLRLACAYAVLIFHLGWSSSGGASVEQLVGTGVQFPGQQMLRHGSVGVPIFFVISGFVIAGSASRVKPLRFLRRRAERLYPAIFICAPITAMVWIAVGRPVGHTAALLVKSLLLIPVGGWIDGPYWTLGVEVWFYALVFVIISVAGQRHLKSAAIVLACIGSAYWLLLTLHASAGLSSPAMQAFVHWRPLSLHWLVHFALGMLIFFAKQERLNAGGTAALVIAAAAGLVQTSQLLRPDLTHAAPALLWLTGVAVIALSKPTVPEKAHPAIRLAGLTTYPLYLIHFAVGLVLVRLAVDAGSPPIAAIALVTICLTGFAAAVAAFLEPLVRSILVNFMEAIAPRAVPRG